MQTLVSWALLLLKSPLTAQDPLKTCGPACFPCQSLTRISHECPCLRQEASNAGRGLCIKAYFRRVGLGRRLLLAAQKQTEETEMRGFMARNAPRGSLVYPENEASLLSGMQGAGLPLQHPSLTTRAPLFGHWEGCSQREHYQVVATSCWSMPPQELCTHPSCGCLISHWPECISALISLRAPISHCFHPISTGQGTDAWGRHTCRGGAKKK